MNYIINNKSVMFQYGSHVYIEDKEDFLMIAEENYWEGDNLKDIIEKNIDDITKYYTRRKYDK